MTMWDGMEPQTPVTPNAPDMISRQAVLDIINSAPRANLQDGRDLVVRTDIIRKVQHYA